MPKAYGKENCGRQTPQAPDRGARSNPNHRLFPLLYEHRIPRKFNKVLPGKTLFWQNVVFFCGLGGVARQSCIPTHFFLMLCT